MNAILNTTLEEQQALADLAARFARRELPAHRLAHEFPYTRDVAAIVCVASGAGLTGINLPAGHGGCGLHAGALAGVLRAIAAEDAGIAALLFTHAAAVELLAGATTDETAQADAVWARADVAGGTLLAFASCTAPEETMPLVVIDGDVPRLTGTVPFLVNGGLARHAVVAGRVNGAEVFQWFLVDLDDPGVARREPVLTLGFQACRTVDAELRDVPALRLDGDGLQRFRAMQAGMSIAAAGLSLGLMQGAFATALDYARQRRQGGRLLVDWPALRMKLADMAIRIDVARAALDGLLQARDAGTPAAGRRAIATALHLGDLAGEVATEGMQLLGGNGYMKDYGQEKRLRDARQARCLLGMHGLKKLHCIDSLFTEQNP